MRKFTTTTRGQVNLRAHAAEIEGKGIHATTDVKGEECHVGVNSGVREGWRNVGSNTRSSIFLEYPHLKWPLGVRTWERELREEKHTHRKDEVVTDGMWRFEPRSNQR